MVSFIIFKFVLGKIDDLFGVNNNQFGQCIGNVYTWELEVAETIMSSRSWQDTEEFVHQSWISHKDYVVFRSDLSNKAPNLRHFLKLSNSRLRD